MENNVFSTIGLKLLKVRAIFYYLNSFLNYFTYSIILPIRALIILPTEIYSQKGIVYNVKIEEQWSEKLGSKLHFKSLYFPCEC